MNAPIWHSHAGATFWMEGGPKGEKHLFFVLNDPMPIPGFGKRACLVVNASTPGRYVDTTCMLAANCHPSITHESFVFYRRAQVMQADEIDRKVAAGVYPRGKPANVSLIRRIVSFMPKDADELSDEMQEISVLVEAHLETKPK